MVACIIIRWDEAVFFASTVGKCFLAGFREEWLVGDFIEVKDDCLTSEEMNLEWEKFGKMPILRVQFGSFFYFRLGIGNRYRERLSMLPIKSN